MGETAEFDFPMGKAPGFLMLGTGRATRDFQAEHGGGRRAGGNCWPMEPCLGSGVNASQAGELREFLADRGCKTYVTSDGDPVYTSSGHRRKALKLRGMHDKAGY